MDNKIKKALIAMSGGVDSSVAAYLMKKKGYECLGTTMRLYRKSIMTCINKTCCSESDIEDAEKVAEAIGIDYKVVNYTVDFTEKVIDKFISSYEAGTVPNPCIDCNRYMKFDKLFSYARENGFDKVVTGHYVRNEFDPESGKYILKKALFPEKDQSYVLYMLTQEQLSFLEFPLGELKKDEVRSIAEGLSFVNAEKRDSQDICFVPDGDYPGFMERFTGKKYPEGQILDLDGNVLGTHNGAIRYTRGQRRGLGVSAAEPLYVIDKDMEKNTVIIGPEKALFSDTLYAKDVNWVSGTVPEKELRVTAKTRYRQKEQSGTVYPEGSDRIRLIFDEPQRAITKGQAVVMYDGDSVIGGGTIESYE